MQDIKKAQRTLKDLLKVNNNSNNNNKIFYKQHSSKNKLELSQNELVEYSHFIIHY